MKETCLSVNINKVATLRNARGGAVPDVVKFALDCERYGAQGITVHPRPDGRHIRYSDVYALREVISTELNVEGYPSAEFLDLVTEVRPAQVTLVPDPPDAITSQAGWNTLQERDLLQEVILHLKGQNIRVSLFMETNRALIEEAAALGADRVELYTGPFAHDFPISPSAAVAPYSEAALWAHELGLGLNAGHDLNLENLHFFRRHLPNLLEVSIGHALICDALYLGIENTIQLYRRQLIL
jgi:pyridoxine 5-phosphate synthase